MGIGGAGLGEDNRELAVASVAMRAISSTTTHDFASIEAVRGGLSLRFLGETYSTGARIARTLRGMNYCTLSEFRQSDQTQFTNILRTF